MFIIDILFMLQYCCNSTVATVLLQHLFIYGALWGRRVPIYGALWGPRVPGLMDPGLRVPGLRDPRAGTEIFIKIYFGTGTRWANSS